MEDKKIVELYWKRDEKAITETQIKYGRYCFSIANNILHNREDVDESVNDTFFSAWNSIPPHRPERLSTFLGKITRQLSLKKWRDKTVKKRGGGKVIVTLEELEECIPSGKTIDDEIQAKEIATFIDAFLRSLPIKERQVFLCRYWYFDSITDICSQFGFGRSKVKMMLLRTREKLLKQLEKEGVFI